MLQQRLLQENGENAEIKLLYLNEEIRKYSLEKIGKRLTFLTFSKISLQKIDDLFLDYGDIKMISALIYFIENFVTEASYE